LALWVPGEPNQRPTAVPTPLEGPAIRVLHSKNLRYLSPAKGKERAMTPLPEPVARVLEQHGPFPNIEAKESMIARLLSLWHVLHSTSGPIDDDAMLSGRSQRQRR
jgi:hypothetical protein